MVKSATDHTTLGIADSCSCEHLHEWDEGRWCFTMDIDWRTDRTSVVKEHTNPIDGDTFDRWIVKTSIELYLWLSTGFMKLFRPSYGSGIRRRGEALGGGPPYPAPLLF